MVSEPVGTGYGTATVAESSRHRHARHSRIDDPSRCIPHLLRLARHSIDSLHSDPLVIQKRTQTAALIQSCAGIWLEYTTVNAQASPGARVPASLLIVNRSAEPFRLERITLPFSGRDTIVNAALPLNKPVRIQADMAIPLTQQPSQQYWLKQPSTPGYYRVGPAEPIGLALGPDPCFAVVELSHPAGSIRLRVPLMTRTVDPVEGEIYDPFPIVPPVSLRVMEEVLVFPSGQAKALHVSVRPGAEPVRGTLHLTIPAGWQISPPSFNVNLAASAGDTIFAFQITPGPHSANGGVTAAIDLPGTSVTTSTNTITYRHIPRQTLLAPARARILRSSIQSTVGTAGYIMGAGDDVPAAIEQLGYHVTLLSDEQIASGDLERL